MSDPFAWLHDEIKPEPTPAARPSARHHEPAPAGTPMAWADEANCRTLGLDWSLFFPDDTGPIDERAVEACRTCPVLAECRDWAVRNERFGYWGGMTMRARAKLRKTLGIEVPTAHPDEETGVEPSIEELTRGGVSARVIAEVLGVTRRTVVRHRTGHSHTRRMNLNRSTP